MAAIVVVVVVVVVIVAALFEFASASALVIVLLIVLASYPFAQTKPAIGFDSDSDSGFDSGSVLLASVELFHSLSIHLLHCS